VTPRGRVLGAVVAMLLSLFAGAMFVWSGLRHDDLSYLAVGAAFPVVTALLLWPVTRWLRRGDGPHPTRSTDDDGREAYVRLRHSGGNSSGH
jgi:membrane protein implicated in regulation of membrane protease activity